MLRHYCLYFLSFLILSTSVQAMKRASEDNKTDFQIEAQERENQAKIERNYRWSRRVNRLKNAAYQAGKCVGIGCGMYAGKDYQAMQFLYATLGMQLMPMAQTTFGELKEAVWPSELTCDIDELELNFLKKKHLLREETNMEITNSLFQARQFAKPKPTMFGSDPNEQKRKLNSLRKLQYLVNIPVKTKKIEKSYQSISNEIDAYFGVTYDDKLRAHLKKFAFQIIKRANGDGTNLRKRPAFFLGSPGTGKTTAAQELARILERPFCHLNLSKIKPERLVGKPGFGEELLELGEIAKCFIQQEGTNNVLDPIIFLDEIHDAVNSKSKSENQFQAILKELLDPDQRWFKDEALGVKLDVSRVTWILAGNTPPTDCEGALGQRMTTLIFPPVTKEARSIIAERHLVHVAKLYGYILSESDFEMMQQILNADTHDGARVLLSVIESYVSHQAAIQQGMNSEDIKFELANEFEMAGGITSEEWDRRERYQN